MRKLRTQAELLAQVNVPVLIIGESGAGKEVAARLIHKLSRQVRIQVRQDKLGSSPKSVVSIPPVGAIGHSSDK
jgi:DNA-binding NtrC family response regulator